MTYLITGTLLREDKPEKYLNTYVDAEIVDVPGYKSRTVKTCSSKMIADWMNKRGHNFKFNQSLELAIACSEEYEVTINDSKLFEPLCGWEEYLTRRYSETKNTQTVSGELCVWRETRLPTPWVYLLSKGNLAHVFEFTGSHFAKNPGKRHSGNKTTYGLLTPVINLSYTCTNIQTIKYEQPPKNHSLLNIYSRP